MFYVAFSRGNLRRNSRYYSLSASVLLHFGFSGCSWPHCSPGADLVITVSICPFLQQVWLWFTNPCDTWSSQCEEQKWSGSSQVVLGGWLTSDLAHLIAVHVSVWQVIYYKHHLLCGGLHSKAKIPLGTCSMLDTRCCLLSVVQSTVLNGQCPEINTVLELQALNFLCETKLLHLGMWVKTNTLDFFTTDALCALSVELFTHCAWRVDFTTGSGNFWVATEKSSQQKRTGAGDLAWVWCCLSRTSVYTTGLLYVSLKCLSYGGNKYCVMFFSLLAMKAVCCTWWDLLGSAFLGAEVSAPEPR